MNAVQQLIGEHCLYDPYSAYKKHRRMVNSVFITPEPERGVYRLCVNDREHLIPPREAAMAEDLYIDEIAAIVTVVFEKIYLRQPEGTYPGEYGVFDYNYKLIQQVIDRICEVWPSVSRDVVIRSIRLDIIGSLHLFTLPHHALPVLVVSDAEYDAVMTHLKVDDPSPWRSGTVSLEVDTQTLPQEGLYVVSSAVTLDELKGMSLHRGVMITQHNSRVLSNRKHVSLLTGFYRAPNRPAVLIVTTVGNRTSHLLANETQRERLIKGDPPSLPEVIDF